MVPSFCRSVSTVKFTRHQAVARESSVAPASDSQTSTLPEGSQRIVAVCGEVQFQLRRAHLTQFPDVARIVVVVAATTQILAAPRLLLRTISSQSSRRPSCCRVVSGEEVAMASLPWVNLIHQGLSQFKASAANSCNSAMLLEGSTETSFSSPIRLMRRISKGSPEASSLVQDSQEEQYIYIHIYWTQGSLSAPLWTPRPHLPPLPEPGLLQQAWLAGNERPSLRQTDWKTPVGRMAKVWTAEQVTRQRHMGRWLQWMWPKSGHTCQCRRNAKGSPWGSLCPWLHKLSWSKSDLI